MNYLGLDVHSKAIVWHLLDATGQTIAQGKTATTVPELKALFERLKAAHEELLVGQEIGKMAYLVHDAATECGVRLLSFNAWHLRMIASSRKKTDRRDAYWIAKALQTGMTPTPVYMPTGEVRQLRALLSRRDALQGERTRWRLRSRTFLLAAGYTSPRSRRAASEVIKSAVNSPDGIDETLAQSLELCERMELTLSRELAELDALLHVRAEQIEVVQRLQTIPAVGVKVALTIYAWVGDVTRFRSARELGSYAGMVPSINQSGTTERLGNITRMGSPQLRAILVQAGHVLLSHCKSAPSAPLKAIALRVQSNRARRKIAVVAAARHILRIAYYVMRDGTSYDPERLRSSARTPSPLASIEPVPAPVS